MVAKTLIAPLCHVRVDPQGSGDDAVHMFSCCPRALFHERCLAPLVVPGSSQVSCSSCADQGHAVSIEWFTKMCHINGVEFPAEVFFFET